MASFSLQLAGAVLMLLRPAMAAATGHAISLLMLNAGVRDIPATVIVYVSVPVRDGCRRLVPAKGLPVSHSADEQLVAVSASLTRYTAGRVGRRKGRRLFAAR